MCDGRYYREVGERNLGTELLDVENEFFLSRFFKCKSGWHNTR